MEMNRKTLRNVFLGVGACILLYWLLHETERFQNVLALLGGVISPFAVGAAIAFVLNVPMRSFERMLSPFANPAPRRLLSVLLTVAAVMLAVLLVFWLLIPQLVATVESLAPRLYDFFMRTGTSVNDFLKNNPELMDWVMANTDLESFDWAGLAQKVISMLGSSVSTILGGAFSAIGGVTSALMDLFISIVFALYCLFQKETLSRQGRKLLYAFLPERFSDETVRILRLSNSTFSNFLSGQCIEVVILGVLFAVSMAVFRMPYIPLVSVLVAVTAFIPVVGAWVGCALGAFFILVNDPMMALWFVGMFLVLQQIENNLIYPRVVGTSIGLSGMWVLVAVGVGGELMGVVGMFLMIPVASVLYTLLGEVTHKRLAQREIPAEKLEPQPPQMRAGFLEKCMK